MALAAYRHVLRSARIAFQGDLPILQAARLEARTAFEQKASLQPNDPAVGPAIAHAEEVAKILTENIVQGKNIGGDKYSKFSCLSFSFSFPSKSMCVLSVTICSEKHWYRSREVLFYTELRIHEKTERGDNDTIKMPNGQKVVIDGKPCSQR
ncbi:hypothetical protein HYALB_00003043 [Hymenoscyphus albidus]|uniref:Mitochondrial zinc maintenance protein 1, mitochondrial n=1 Tax=Hymenoscyphus albidus TaxID=595503 RepID=A0A9N9LZV7_9HELO|nr:hypothetical protein HYALB_00003043 [Hymenoscyphus albidus]